MLQDECDYCHSKNLIIDTTGTFTKTPHKRFKCEDCFAYQKAILSEEDCRNFNSALPSGGAQGDGNGQIHQV